MDKSLNKICILVIPALLVAVVVSFVPLIYIIKIVFETSGISDFLYSNLHDRVRILIFIRSLLLPLIVTFLSVILGIVAGLAFVSCRNSSKLFIEGSLLIPLLIHPMVLVFGFLVLARQGSVAALTYKIFLWLGPHGSSWAMTTIIMTFLLFPYIGWFTGLSLSEIPNSELLASWNAGSSPFQTIKNIMLPRVKDSIIAGSILVFIQGSGYFIAPVLVGDGWVNTFPVFISDRIESGMIGQASVMALLLLIPLTILLILSLKRIVVIWKN